MQDHDLLDAIVKRVDEITHDLKVLTDIVADLKDVVAKDAAAIRAEREAAINARRAFAAANRYMSGRWPRRDGDTYGIVQAQPKVTTLPTPPVLPDNDMVTPDANGAAGDIRSSDER